MAKKRIVAPKSKEYKRITKRLVARYPQMYETTGTPGQRKAWSRLSASERRILKPMMGLRMKKKYGKRPKAK